MRKPRPPAGRTAAQGELASASSNPPANALSIASITASIEPNAQGLSLPSQGVGAAIKSIPLHG